MSTCSFQITNPKPDGPRQLWLVCSPGDPQAQEMTLDQIPSEELCEPPVTIVSQSAKENFRSNSFVLFSKTC